jgi:hypothetical protein
MNLSSLASSRRNMRKGYLDWRQIHNCSVHFELLECIGLRVNLPEVHNS